MGGLTLLERNLTVDDAFEIFYGSKSQATVNSYRQAMDAFSQWVGVSAQDAVRTLVAGSNGQANMLARAWKSAMLDAKLAPNTINQRLAALRSILKAARTLGLIAWQLDCPAVKAKSYRDTSGTSASETQAIMGAVRKQGRKLAARNEAIIRLMYDLALRRQSVIDLDIESVDLERCLLTYKSKGSLEPKVRSLPGQTVRAIRAWLREYGVSSGPLFPSISKHGYIGDRITGRGLHHVIKDLGERVNVKARPHGFRHSSINEILEQTNGNIMMAKEHSGHARIQTLISYWENRQDLAGKAAEIVANTLEEAA